MVAGIVLASVGAGSALTGGVLYGLSNAEPCGPGTCSDRDRDRTVGIIGMIGGGALVVAGVPMIIIGAPMVAAKRGSGLRLRITTGQVHAIGAF